MVRRICDIMVTLDLSFRSCTVVVKMFHSTLLSECVGRHQVVLIANVVQKTQLETLFKGDNVKAFVKTSNCENMVLYFSQKVQKIAAFAMLFWFSVTKQSFGNGFGFPQ